MNSQKNIFYVYKHTFKNNTAYIGKGKGKRAYELKRNRFWNNLCKKYGLPTIEFLHKDLYENEAFELEKLEIEKCKQNGVKLCNLTNGGEGMNGYKHTEESKLKMSKLAKGRVITEEQREISRQYHLGKIPYNKGMKMSEEQKLKISIAKSGKNHQNYGKKLDISVREKISKSLMGEKHPNYDHTIYHFKNTIDNIIVSMTKTEFRNKFNLHSSGVSKMCIGYVVKYKNWTCLNSKKSIIA